MKTWVPQEQASGEIPGNGIGCILFKNLPKIFTVVLFVCIPGWYKNSPTAASKCNRSTIKSGLKYLHCDS